MVNNQQSFIDQAIDQWQDCFNAYVNARSKHVTVMTFKAYVTADMEKIDLFHFTR